MCAYQANIPQPTDALSQSQSDLLNNFAAIKTLIDIDHEDFASPNQGQHFRVTLPVQTVTPTFAVGSVGLYNKLSAVTSVNELFIVNSAGTTTPLTASQQAAHANGWTYLPSGVLMKWGSGISANPGVYTYVFPAAPGIPAFANIFSIIVTTAYSNAGDGNGFVRLNTFTAPWTQFTVYSSHRTTTGPFSPVGFQYLAIGN